MDRTENPSPKLRLDDYYLCGYLSSNGFMPNEVEDRRGGKRCFVYSENRKQVSGLVREFYAGNVSISIPLLRTEVTRMREAMQSGELP